MSPTTSQPTRRAFLGASLGALVFVSACSTERTSTKGKGSSAAAGASDGVVTVNFTGPITQLYANWNPFSPAENTGAGTAYFYEPLLRLDRFHGNEPRPWLAEKWDISPDATTITFHLRKDVTWSDGKKLVADDVVFTLTAATRFKGTSLVVTDLGVKSAKAVDENTVEVVFAKGSLGNLVAAGLASILPAHIFGSEKLETWTNPKPVGTGPFVISAFSPQQVTLDVRKDYWGGGLGQVKQVKWAVYGNEDSGKALIRQGKVDAATMAWPDAKTTLENADNNVYRVFPTGGGTAIQFNCAVAPFNDVHARRALAKAFDFKKMLSLADIGTPLANVTGMSELVWGDVIAPEFRGKTVAQDAAAAKAELKAGGWTVEGGKLVKDGKSYALTIKAVTEYANWGIFCDGLKGQVKDVLGLDLQVQRIPDAQHYEQLQKGEYTIAMNFGPSENLAGDFYKSLNKRDIVPIGEKASANLSRYGNDEVSRLLDEIAASVDQDEVVSKVQQIQKIVVDEVPYITYNQGGQYVSMSGRKWTGVPKPEDRPDYVPYPGSSVGFGPNVTLFLKNLKPA
jgi:peptide/nickel transport system substrate-binding protein